MLSNIIDYLSFIIVRAIISLMRVLPQAMAYGFAKGIVRLLVLIFRRWRKVGLRNLELVFPDMSLAKRKELLERSFDMLALNLLTFARFPEIGRDYVIKHVDFSNCDAVLDEVAKENGSAGKLILTMHFGCFELSHRAMSFYGEPFAILARGFGLPRLDSWWNAQRSELGREVIWRKGGVQEIFNLLRNGESVAMLVDQNVKKNHATFVEFFGIKAAMTKTPAIAAIRTGAAVFFGYLVANQDGTFKYFVEKLPNPNQESGSTEEKINKFSQNLANAMERAIRQAPDHWFWIHRRFKTRPPGEPKLY